MAAKATLSAAQADKILADYEVKTEARAAKKAAAYQAKHSKLADDATPSRWDNLAEEEQAEALTSSEEARPPGHEASEEETAKANKSHVYDEDGIRVFE